MFAQKTSGGASETVATYENSRTGVRQLSVGRHIGDRSHLSEKSRNEFTGEEEKREALVNIAYEELGGFDQEWRARMAP
ncbi:myeloid leukemia factor 2-like [Haemaphysalis longicornis]